MYDRPELYDLAKMACFAHGLPWTDPRTGITHYPPPLAESIDPRLNEDGLWELSSPKLMAMMKGGPWEGKEAGTVLIVRDGRLYGMKAVALDDPDGLRTILAQDGVKLRRIE